VSLHRLFPDYRRGKAGRKNLIGLRLDLKNLATMFGFANIQEGDGIW
jgi:hypothetical protein